MKGSFWLTLIVTLLLSGCSRNIITVMSKETRKNVYQEIPEASKIPVGYAELIVSASLKTVKPGSYPSENGVRGTPAYVLLVNIDGQVTSVSGNMMEENSDPRWPGDPDAGDGIRYLYQKNLLLNAGHHKVFVALPEEGIAVQRDLDLTEASIKVIKLNPIYGSKKPEGKPGLGLFSSSSFKQGIDGFYVTLLSR